jgi:hypothetical protein
MSSHVTTTVAVIRTRRKPDMAIPDSTSTSTSSSISISSDGVSFEETCAAYEIADQIEYEEVMAALDDQAGDASTGG